MRHEASRTDWASLVRQAQLRFGINPEAFWRLSLMEWQALHKDSPSIDFTQSDLSNLINLYPDEKP